MLENVSYSLPIYKNSITYTPEIKVSYYKFAFLKRQENTPHEPILTKQTAQFTVYKQKLFLIE